MVSEHIQTEPNMDFCRNRTVYGNFDVGYLRGRGFNQTASVRSDLTWSNIEMFGTQLFKHAS